MPKVPADKWAKNSLRLILPCFEFGNELLEFGNDLFGLVQTCQGTPQKVRHKVLEVKSSLTRPEQLCKDSKQTRPIFQIHGAFLIFASEYSAI